MDLFSCNPPSPTAGGGESSAKQPLPFSDPTPTSLDPLHTLRAPASDESALRDGCDERDQTKHTHRTRRQSGEGCVDASIASWTRSVLGRALPHVKGRRTEVSRLSTLSVRFLLEPRRSCFAHLAKPRADIEPFCRPARNPIISPRAALSAQVLSTCVQNIIKTISMRSCGVKLS